MREHGFGLLDVEIRDVPALEARHGDGQRLSLQFDVGARVVDFALDRANLDIGRGDVAQQRDQHLVVVLDRDVQIFVGRFDGPAELAPEVDLPGQVEPLGPLIVKGLLHKATIGVVLAERIAEITPRRVLRLRKEVATRYGQLRSGLQHAEACFTQRQILTIGRVDQPIDYRIVKYGPPARISSGTEWTRLSSESIHFSATGAVGR